MRVYSLSTKKDTFLGIENDGAMLNLSIAIAQYELAAKKPIKSLGFEAIRGAEGIKKGKITIGESKIVEIDQDELRYVLNEAHKLNIIGD